MYELWTKGRSGVGTDRCGSRVVHARHAPTVRPRSAGARAKAAGVLPVTARGAAPAPLPQPPGTPQPCASVVHKGWIYCDLRQI